MKKPIKGSNRPKTIIWDTEVSTALVRGYGNKWDFRYVKEVRPQELMSYSWKELGSKTVHFVHMHKFKNQHDFVKSLADLLNSADITIAHNGINFDDKMANTFFIRNGIDRPSPSKSIDTLRVARRKFKFPSNSLGDLGEYLGLGGKESVAYSELEDKFLEGNKKAIKLMKKYNDRDVTLLEAIYKKLLPYIDNHPNMGVYMREEGVCAHCGSTNLNRRGEAYRVTGSVVQWFCKDCKSWSYDRVATPETKPTLVGK